jgi:hypothetical protein
MLEALIHSFNISQYSHKDTVGMTSHELNTGYCYGGVSLFGLFCLLCSLPSYF